MDQIQIPTPPPFPCNHCGRNLMAGDDLQYAIYLYGIFFLQGKSDGFIGTTCPSCVKTTCGRFDKNGFDYIVAACQIFVFQGYPHPDSLRYFSPFTSSPENFPDSYKYVTEFASEVHDNVEDIEITEQKILIEYDKDESDLYHTYVFGLGRCMVPYFYILWLSINQIEELLKAENSGLLSILPRYIYKSDTIEDIDKFCWIYRCRENYFTNIEKHFQRYSNCEIIENNKNDIGYDFHSILINQPNPWLFSNQQGEKSYLAWRKNRPSFGLVQFYSSDEKVMDDFDLGMFNQKQIQALRDNFSKEYAQLFLSEKSDLFINDYISIIRNANWSFLDIWNLKNEYMNQYYKSVHVGISNEKKYAFYENGGTWTVVFDGKPITGLDSPGFIFIYFLIKNKDVEKTHWELLAFESSITKKSIWYGLDVDEELLKDEDAVPCSINENDEYSDSSEKNKKTKNIKYSDNLNVSEHISTSQFFYSGRKEYLKNDYDKLKNRNSMAIKRALDQLKSKAFLGASKHVIDAEKHFRSSIKGHCSNKIVYIPNDESINWFL